jgi:hypothetical protein
MAAYYIFRKSDTEFYNEIYKERNPELIIKLVKCVINAFKRKKKSIDVFEVTFKNTEQLTYTINKDSYIECLENYMPDLIQWEEFEICAEVHKIITKPKRLTYKKSQNEEDSGEMDVSGQHPPQ